MMCASVYFLFSIAFLPRKKSQGQPVLKHTKSRSLEKKKRIVIREWMSKSTKKEKLHANCKNKSSNVFKKPPHVAWLPPVRAYCTMPIYSKKER